MAVRSISESNYLTGCLCKLQLPHSEEHAKALPKPIMPTLQLEEEKCSSLKSPDKQRRRIQELMQDVQKARDEDLQIQRKMEKEAGELLKAYEAGEKSENWVPEDILNSGDDEGTVRLKYELNHSRFQLAEVRNQLHSLKHELAAYEKLARQEIGDDVNLHEVLTSSRWRGRAQEIKRLQTEIQKMESKAFHHKYLKNPLSIPSYEPRFPDVNDLVPPSQARVLKREARKKKEQKERSEKAVSDLIQQYGDISTMYKASITHNKLLAEELRSLKEQQEKYDTRTRENNDLIKNLIVHQIQMKEMIDREAYLVGLVKKKENEDRDLEKEGILDAVKYKALYEASENEKCSLEKMIEMLTKRLEVVIQSAEEAEKHCEDNETRREEMEKQIEAHKAEMEASKPKTAGKGKTGYVQNQPAVKYLPTFLQLQAVKEENKFLRNFLLQAIETKVEDLKLYQFTMENIREQYTEALKNLRGQNEDNDTDNTAQ